MVEEDSVRMSVRELKRVQVLEQVRERRLTQGQAAALLGMTTRHVRRLLQRIEQEGARGVAHRGRGRPSNRRIAPGPKRQALQLYARYYRDYGPTLAAEQLAERHGVTLSAETLRRWLHAAGVTHFRRRARPHRTWRPRKAHVGQLLQLDGSHHAWFEDRGPTCVLMAYIDDASSRVAARFYAYEGTGPAMDSFKRYIRRYGLPHGVYTDKHTTYRSPGEPTVAQQLAGELPRSQFERALAELGVELIHAHSPQAKGRVERLFKTLQDRLVKALRLADIATLEAANAFLETWLPAYNRRFAYPPAAAADLHRPAPPALELDQILCLKTTRVVRRDGTVAHQGRLYQLDTPMRAPHVLVEDRLDGTMRILHHGRPLRYHLISARQDPLVAPAPLLVRRQRLVKPRRTHPWHRRFLPDRQTSAATQTI